MIQLRSTATVIFLALIIAGCSKEHPSDTGPPVAKIGNEYIYLYDVISPADSAVFFQRGFEFRKKQISSYVMREMYVKEGYKRGFHKNDSVIEKMDLFVKSRMVNIVYRGEILERYAGEAALRKLYENLKKQVSGRHILITYSGTSSAPPEVSRSKDGALNVITKIRSDINSQEDFILFADSLSEDRTSVNGGSLGFFKWGDMEDSFQEVAFSLPINTLSEPVESSYGYHLIWIDSVKSVKLDSFNKMEARLRSKLYTMRNEVLIKAAESFVDSLNNIAGTVINMDKIDELIKNILTYLQTNRSAQSGKSPAVFLNEQKENGPLATYFDREVTTQVLIDLIKNRSTGMAITTFTDSSLVKNIVAGEINKAVVSKFGFDNDYDKRPEVKKELKKKEREFVWQEIRESEFSKEMNNTDDDLKKYYNEHKDNYVSKRKSDIVEILVSDKNLADSLYALSNNGADMTELAVKFSERKKVAKSLGIIKDVTILQMGKIGKMVSSMSVGDISKPVKIGKSWSLFKILSVKEPEYEPFDNIRNRILVDFRGYERNRLIDKFESYVTDKYKPQYYYKNLDDTVVEGTVE